MRPGVPDVDGGPRDPRRILNFDSFEWLRSIRTGF